MTPGFFPLADITFEIPGFPLPVLCHRPNSISALGLSIISGGGGADPDSRRSQVATGTAPLTAVIVASGVTCYKTGRALVPSVSLEADEEAFLSRLFLKAFAWTETIFFVLGFYFHVRVENFEGDLASPHRKETIFQEWKKLGRNKAVLNGFIQL